MQNRRFRIRSLMVLVFLSALALAAYDQAGRLDRLDLTRIKEGSILFVPFLIMVALKFGLVMASRAKRAASEESTRPTPPDDALP
jgi:hypothetical protein